MTGYGANILSVMISFGIMIWFVIFTVLVLVRLDKVIEVLSKKQ